MIAMRRLKAGKVLKRTPAGCRWWAAIICALTLTAEAALTSRIRRSAVFSPYNLTPGGGEKYLLSAARAFQTLGDEVDVLVMPDNICQTLECVMEVATSLRVPLDPDLTRVQVVHREVYKLFAGPYHIFLAMGNEKYPPAVAVGQINYFMCQFPFDLGRESPEGAAVYMLAGYDAVLLNSHYSLRWYYTYSTPLFDEIRSADHLFPRMHVMHPPVTLPPSDMTGSPAKQHIVMVGRFFAGRQSKGHPEAVRIFYELAPSLPPETKLLMVGNPMPGHSQYLEDLRAQIFQLGLNEKIEIVVRASPEQVVYTQKSALVQWHLTGLGVQNDPASLEHFGISIVEGMATGAIPVAYIGGAADAIRHGVEGFIASSAKKFIEYTRKIFSMSPQAQRLMQQRCMDRATAFQYDRFERRLHDLINATETMKPSLPLVAERVRSLRM